MKINTLEKMEILILGLNAGRELDIMIASGKDGWVICSDIHGLGFRVDDNGTVESWVQSNEEEKDRYTIQGCISESKKEAKKYFKRKVNS
jgi:hypothetical protein